MSRPVRLVVVEGVLEAPAALRLLAEAGIARDSVVPVVAGGTKNFWANAARYNRAARLGPVFGLADLEAHACPVTLISGNLRGPKHPDFVLRVAVRELESWLLADAKGWASYLRISEALVPREPETLTDAKQALVNLVRESKVRRIVEDVVPEKGRTGPVGPGYTTRITEFIGERWVPRRAAERSPSLRRALKALRDIGASQAP